MTSFWLVTYSVRKDCETKGPVVIADYAQSLVFFLGIVLQANYSSALENPDPSVTFFAGGDFQTRLRYSLAVLFFSTFEYQRGRRRGRKRKEKGGFPSPPLPPLFVPVTQAVTKKNDGLLVA